MIKQHKGEPHPWYGPCDGLGDDGCCSECAEITNWTDLHYAARVIAFQEWELETANSICRRLQKKLRRLKRGGRLDNNITK